MCEENRRFITFCIVGNFLYWLISLVGKSKNKYCKFQTNTTRNRNVLSVAYLGENDDKKVIVLMLLIKSLLLEMNVLVIFYLLEVVALIIMKNFY